MAQGWISLHRQLQKHWLWADKPFSKGQAWIDLLLSANHCDRKVLLGNELIEVKAGSFITSELKLMERWGWSKSKVRKFLEVLQSDGMIVKNSDKKKTTIIIENYSVYQYYETTERPPADHGKTTERPQKDTNNNDNNDNNENNDNKYISYVEIKDAFNNLCPSLPSIRTLSDARKKAIKARLKNYTVEDLKEAFRKAEASDFLKGGNGNWHADFDWILKDTNLPKILEGKYDNKKQTRNQNSAADKLQESYDMMKEWSES